MKSSQSAHVSHVFRGWLEQLACLLVPPFHAENLSKLCEMVRSELDVEAVSLFLTSETDANQLKMRAGTGYLKGYENETYFLNSAALTSHVFLKKEPRNLSRNEIEKQNEIYRKSKTETPDNPDIIPPTRNKLGKFLKSGKLNNIILVPVKFEANRLGVLKIENKKNFDENQNFPEQDYELAKLLAETIAIIVQQRIYTSLTTKIELASEGCQDIGTYSNRVVSILQRALNAECCSLWLFDRPITKEGGILRYIAGIGYKSEYEDHTYPVDEVEDKIESLTAQLARKRSSIRADEKKLSELTHEKGIKYSGACRSYILSGTFRNILGIALVENDGYGEPLARCWGVVKVENRRPEDTEFGNYDEQLCKKFVTDSIVPSIEQLHKINSIKLGVAILEAKLGPLPEFNSVSDRRQFMQEVIAIKEQSQNEIAESDCYEYLQISKATYNRDKLALRKNQSDSKH